MIENLITMVKMICFSYEYSKDSGYALGLEGPQDGVSPQVAMELMFGATTKPKLVL